MPELPRYKYSVTASTRLKPGGVGDAYMSQANGNSDDSKLVPMIISFFIWGGGQLYEGRTKAGVAWLVAWAVSIVLSVLTVGLFGFVAFVLWLVNLYDTYAVLIDIDD